MHIKEPERLAALQRLKVLDTPPEAVFDSLTELAALTFKAPVALVSLVDAERQWFKSCLGLDVRETPRDVAFCDHTIRQDHTLVVLDARTDPRFRDNALVTGAPGIGFYAGAPLITPEGAALGSLCIIDFAPRAEFPAEQQALLEAMAGSVMNAMLMRRDISDFIALERERTNRQHLLDQADEMAGVGHWSWDATRDVTIWSPTVYEIHGCDPALPPPPLEGVLALYAPEDAARLAGMVAQAVETGEPYELHARVLRPDGEVRHITARGACERDEDGRVRSLFGTFIDVTDLKLADGRLRLNEARLDFLMHHSSDVVVRIAPDRGITWISPSCRRYGYEPEELVGELGSNFIHPDDIEHVEAMRRARLSGAKDPPAEERRFRFLCKDGTWIWVEGNPTIVRDEAGTPVEVINVLRDVSTRKEMEDRLAGSEARYRLLANNSSDVIACYGPDAVFTFLSPALRNLSGYAPEELIGRTTMSIMHPDDVGPVLKKFAAYVAAGPQAPPIRYEYRAFRKDGSMLWLEAHPRAIYGPDGALVEFQDVVRDISERKAAEAALVESELRHRVIAECATDVITRAQLDGKLAYASPSVLAVTGFTFEELREVSILSRIDGEDLVPALAHVRRMIAGETMEAQRLSYRFQRKDGTWIWLECNPTVVRDVEGRAIEIVDVLRDVSAQHQIEAELRAARDAAEAAVQVKSDFLANMSHEIRTPLTAILGFTRLLDDEDGLNETARQHVGRVSAAGEALLSIVNDILDFSKLEAGLVEIAPRAVPPARVLEDALAMFSPQADAKGLSLALTGAADLPDFVAVDAERLRQVLLNLLGNAVKFTDAGSVRLAAEYLPGAERLRIAVEDTGPGLSKEQQRKLFQRFSQVDTTSTRQHGGTGLGLAICRGLVEAMGGRIDVRSKPGQGSVFHFEIDAPLAEAPAGGAEETGGVSLEDLRVLVVDDNEINRELLRTVLIGLGAELSEAADGPSGLEVANARPVDLILMDVRMPGMNGPEVLAAIRAGNGPNQNVPILAFTADGDPARLTRDCGFDGVIRKPIVVAEMYAAMGVALGWTGAADAEPLRHAS